MYIHVAFYCVCTPLELYEWIFRFLLDELRLNVRAEGLYVWMSCVPC